MGRRGPKVVNTRDKQPINHTAFIQKLVLIKSERQTSDVSFVLQNFDQERLQTIEQKKWSTLHSVASVAPAARENKASVSHVL